MCSGHNLENISSRRAAAAHAVIHLSARDERSDLSHLAPCSRATELGCTHCKLFRSEAADECNVTKSSAKTDGLRDFQHAKHESAF